MPGSLDMYPAAVVRTGYTVKRWPMLDYNSINASSRPAIFRRKLRSTSIAQNANPADSALRFTPIAWRRKAIFSNESPHDWDSVSSDSMSEILWKIAGTTRARMIVHLVDGMYELLHQ